MRPRGRVLNPTFKRLAEYHLFEPRLCNVGRGNEKGHVENGVKWARKHPFVPVPRFSDWSEFNERIGPEAPLLAVHTRCHRRGQAIYEPISITYRWFRLVVWTVHYGS